MNSRVKTQTLHINSRMTSSTACQYDVTLPNLGVSCEQDEVMSISLQSFSCFFDTHLVSDATLTLNGTLISIPPGSYSFKRLCKVVNDRFGSNVCSWVRERNTIAFTSRTGQSLTLDPGSAADLLGFEPGVHVGVYIEGEYAMDPLKRLSNINVHIDGVTPYRCWNMDDVNGYMDPSTVLCCIPFDAAPFSWYCYEPPDAQPLIVHEKQLTMLRLRFTDVTGKLLDGLLPHHTMVLRVDTHIATDESEQLAVLQELKTLSGLTRMQLLSKHLHSKK
jgi:hypothetical protein